MAQVCIDTTQASTNNMYGSTDSYMGLNEP